MIQQCCNHPASGTVVKPRERWRPCTATFAAFRVIPKQEQHMCSLAKSSTRAAVSLYAVSQILQYKATISICFNCAILLPFAGRYKRLVLIWIDANRR